MIQQISGLAVRDTDLMIGQITVTQGYERMGTKRGRSSLQIEKTNTHAVIYCFF